MARSLFKSLTRQNDEQCSAGGYIRAPHICNQQVAKSNKITKDSSSQDSKTFIIAIYTQCDLEGLRMKHAKPAQPRHFRALPFLPFFASAASEVKKDPPQSPKPLKQGD